MIATANFSAFETRVHRWLEYAILLCWYRGVVFEEQFVQRAGEFYSGPVIGEDAVVCHDVRDLIQYSLKSGLLGVTSGRGIC